MDNVSTGMTVVWAGTETFRIDLNSVRDDSRVVALMGLGRPQAVPRVGSTVAAVDEDGTFYDATVEAVLPDSRIYLRVLWATARNGSSLPPMTYGFSRSRLDALDAPMAGSK